MKTIFSLFLLVVALYACPVYASCVPGDIAPVGAPDGVVTVSDIVKALRFSVAIDVPNATELLQADVAPATSVDQTTNPNYVIVRGDGTIDVTDVVMLLRAAVGLSELHWREFSLRVSAQEDLMPFESLTLEMRWPTSTCYDDFFLVPRGTFEESLSVGRTFDSVVIADSILPEAHSYACGETLFELHYRAPRAVDLASVCFVRGNGWNSVQPDVHVSLRGRIRVLPNDDSDACIGPDMVGTTFCGVFDNDGDGYADDVDNCSHVANPLQEDVDQDLAGDACDNCPSDPNTNQIDADTDGFGDVCDLCPDDPNKIEPGACGCGVPNTDSDGDATADCNDQCPADPSKVRPGTCGCGLSDSDTDGDGRPNCLDNCPDDPAKSVPGVCGCGVSDVDTDGDGTADCHDGCPTDPTKLIPGICGCGVSDVDTDSDGKINCQDNCPSIANPLQQDTDGDRVGDACDNCRNTANADQADADSDRLGDVCESSYSASSSDPDSDDDGLSDGAEVYEFGSQPNNTNSDGDTWTDGYEVLRYGMSPTHYDLDSDHDGFPEVMEVYWGITNRFGADTDTDHDGFPDLVENQISHTDPANSDDWPRPMP